MYPSIFNDVIGPVMRGPSSSHCAAALRIGHLARDLVDGTIEEVTVQFDRHGSLATTHESQGSDMGLFAGLLDWEATDERLPRSAATIRANGVKVEITIGDFGFVHPNTYRIALRNARQQHVLTALPVLSRKGTSVPFCTCEEILRWDDGRNLPPWELAVQYESQRGNISSDEVLARMVRIVQILRAAIDQGIRGTVYEDRILDHQCGRFQARMQTGGLLDAGLLNHIVLNVTALMEVKSAMGVIVAAPTAGSCAALPGTCLAAADILGLTDEDAAKAMLAAGLIGALVALKTAFAAEVCGCQAECGVASGMTAAALISLARAGIRQAVDAASMAFQSSLGMICDPVANRVEVPCLGKNVMAASNALACANMALAGYDPVVPLDEVIETMDRVGRSLPRELRCTALGGLSVTKTSREIESRLRGKHS